MKYLIISLLMFGCKTTSILFIPQLDNVSSIEITIVDTKKEYVLTDKEVIKIVLSDYITTGKKELRKFIAIYEVVVKGKEQESYLINGHYLKHKGITYEMEKDFSDFVSSLQ